jgi:hypothetical protein
MGVQARRPWTLLLPDLAAHNRIGQLRPRLPLVLLVV